MKLEKKEGSKANCPACDDPIICVLKPGSGNFAAKLQWQNPEGGAHYNFDGTNTTCNTKLEHTTEKKQEIIETDKFSTAVNESNLAWDYAAKKSGEILSSNTQGERDKMILTQVLYKGIVELMK